MNDNYNHDLELFNRLRRGLVTTRIALAVALPMAGTLVAIIVWGVVMTGLGFDISYSCEGVDEEWLKNHPFDTSSLPSKIYFDTPYTLETPSIDGYEFVEWRTKTNKVIENNVLVMLSSGSSSRSNSSEYSSLPKGYTNIAFIERSLVASYMAKDYELSLYLDGGTAVLSPADTFSGKKYDLSQTDFITTSFQCIENEFELPRISKSGYEFVGWKNPDNGTIMTKCVTSACKNFALVPVWNS